MPKTETLIARLSLESYDRYFRLDETRYEICERLYDVLNDDFYREVLTDTLIEQHPQVFEEWTEYKKTRRGTPKKIQAVAKFNVTDKKVDLIDVKFY